MSTSLRKYSPAFAAACAASVEPVTFVAVVNVVVPEVGPM